MYEFAKIVNLKETQMLVFIQDWGEEETDEVMLRICFKMNEGRVDMGTGFSGYEEAKKHLDMMNNHIAQELYNSVKDEIQNGKKTNLSLVKQ